MNKAKDILKSFTIKAISVKNSLVELKIELVDDNNKIFVGVIKNNIDLFLRTYNKDDKVFCKGKLRELKGQNFIDIIYITKQQEINVENSESDVETDIEDYLNRFNEIIENIEDKDYKSILKNCFNEDIKELFFSCPAARENHHNYKYGLLQHSIEVVDVSLFLGNYFGECNKDLLSCAGLLHDIGKIKAYEFTEDNKIQKTIWEDLIGHLPMSSLLVSKMTPQEIDQKKILMLQHLILSHHGKLQFQSPVVCKTKEAFILNKADELSSTMNYLDIIKYNKGKSEFDKLNERNWYKDKEIEDVN